MTQHVGKISIKDFDWRGNVRANHDAQDVGMMAESMKAVGQLNPVLARRVDGRIVGIDGQTRCLAAEKLGWEKLLAIVDDAPLSEGDAAIRSLTSNLARNDLKPLVTAVSVKRVMDLTGCTAAEAAVRIGKSAATVARLLALLDLPEPIAQQVDAGEIGISAGYQIARAKPEQQEELAEAVASGHATRDEVAEKVASQSKGRKKSKRKRERKVVIRLTGGHMVTVSARELSIDVLAACFEEALEKIHAVRVSDGDLNALVRLCREQAKEAAVRGA